MNNIKKHNNITLSYFLQSKNNNNYSTYYGDANFCLTKKAALFEQPYFDKHQNIYYHLCSGEIILYNSRSTLIISFSRYSICRVSILPE